VQVWGGSDIEVEYSTQANSINWVNGYSGRYVDFGDAQGCPSCINGWTDYGVWFVSWGAPPAYPFPEIYYSHQVNEWTNIAQYSVNSQGVSMAFEGPMDEWHRDPNSYPADQSWVTFHNALASGGVNNALPYSTSINTSQ